MSTSLVLRRVSENHETGAVSWAGTYRGRPVGASLALIREKVIENGEKIGEDEVYSLSSRVLTSS